MVTINLLPVKAELRLNAIIQHVIVFAVCVGIIVVGLGILQGTMKREKTSIENDIQKTQVQIADLKVKAEEIEKVKKRRLELEKKLQVINDLSIQKTGPVEVLDELSMLIPEKAWISSFTNTGEKVVLDGTAVDNTVIAEFMKRLQGSKHYTDVELVLSEQEGLNHKFVIQCKIQKIQN
ncbi:MAG TPA: PilN domain-containing protein [Desulfomonilia bacterium]|jgi:type IV pilus assembly protein PilN